jgi:hypothetical protein
MMRPAKWLISLALTIALAAYGLDCMGMATPDQAMKCCEKMRCHSHHHRSQNTQDCCKTTPQMHAVFGQPSSTQAISYSPVALGVVQAFDDSKFSDSPTRIIVGHSHDPPRASSTPVLSLRI